jgi:uncharacterized protein with GYD domain
MHTFIALLNFTDQGIENLKDSPHRADMFMEVAERAGARVKDVYWTIGSHDGVLIIEAPDDETAAAVLLSLAAAGNVRTRTLRAFDWPEFQSVLDRMS